MKNYEISIWEDIPSDVDSLQERKIAVIGSDSMTSEARAFDPVLVRNINGTHTLTFKMYYVCNDFSLGGISQGFEKYTNPFISLMVNERKVKLHWNDEWYDLIIKNCQEDSNGKFVTYTCKDLFLNELGKTGFNLEFDNELLNNSGTVKELAEKVLEGTDWRVIDSQGIVLQEKEEPVYNNDIFNILNNFSATKDGIIPIESKVFTDGDLGSILLFHSSVPTVKTDGSLQGGADQCQFLFRHEEDEEWETETNRMLVLNGDCYSTEKGVWEAHLDSQHPENSYLEFSVEGTPIFEIGAYALVSDKYRGTRLVKSQRQVIDKVLNRSVYVYEKKNDPESIYYGYPSTEFISPTLVNNLFVNADNFKDTEGWLGIEYLRAYPLMQDWDITEEEAYNAVAYLKIPKDSVIFNKGLQDTYMNFPDGFISGEKYIFRYKIRPNKVQGGSSEYYRNIPDTSQYVIDTSVLIPKVASYDTRSAMPTPGNDYFTFNDNDVEVTDDGWVEFTGECTTSISKKDIITGIGNSSTKLGLFLINTNGTNPYWLESIEFFRYVVGLNNEDEEVRINPGELSTRSIAQIYYNYYEPNQNASDPSEIEYIYRDSTDWTEVQPAYRENPFEEVRSITGKNSNRFNFLQAIAETFNCWCRFIIRHNDDGSIRKSDEPPYNIEKYVEFVREVGQKNGLCFTYGLDLKSISRTIISDQITTKMIVPKNNNSFGIDGFCTISRCKENYPKTNYILNFDYYISHGMLDSNELNKDLYSSISEESMGYYYNLHHYNEQYDEFTDILINKKSELTEQLAYQSTYSAAFESTVEELNSCRDYLINLCGVVDMDGVMAFINENKDNADLNARNLNYINLEKLKDGYEALLQSIDISVARLEADIDSYEEQQELIRQQINDLDKRFYSKYFRFIQEGSWISEDYYDDLDYYLDAVNICYTSSRPQVSYNINVMRLSEIEEYKNRKFNLGDICYVEDTDFFGYVQGAAFLTPYREKVLISEVSEALDDPTKSTFKVQNYKTQFEDLFQRITATSQSFQYAQGEYSRAASVVTNERIIEAEVIQNSIAANENLVIEAQNEAIYQDNTGTTYIDVNNPNYKLKVTSKGIFVTSDGVWRNAIRGDGIVTEMLSVGVINTNKIVLSDGNFPTFRWDETGLNAYKQTYLNGEKNGIDFGTAVRFDHFGLYGIEGNSSFTPTSEEEIWEHSSPAKFGLTWKGFFLRTLKNNGSIEISSDNDIILSQKNEGVMKERIKIGRFGEGENEYYGIRISDLAGNPVLETVEDGELWLQKALHISHTEGTTYNIAVGYLNNCKTDTDIHEIFNANNAFVVWEDGSVKGTNVEFTGGKIGNMLIADISDLGAFARISATADAFYGTTPASIVLNASLVDSESSISTFSWSKNGESIPGAETNQYIITNDNSNNYATDLYTVTLRTSNNKTYSDSILINKFPDKNQYILKTSQPEFLKFNERLQEGTQNATTITVFTPQSMSFWAQESEGSIEGALPLENYSYKINIFTTDNTLGTIEDICGTNYYNDYYNFANKIAEDSVGKKYDILLNDFINLEDSILTNKEKILVQQFKNNTVFIQVELYIGDKLSNFINIPVKFGTTSEMATLSLYGAGITAAIQNSKLRFDGSGLTVTNGGFQIITQEENEDPKTVFYIDANTNTLFMEGSIKATSGSFRGTVDATDGIFRGTVEAEAGYFKGSVYADEGTFTGTVNAEAGSIGGFRIENNALYSSETQLLENASIILNGSTGEIIANNIQLGSGATITGSIQLGAHSFIRNPSTNNGVFIESSGIKIIENGVNSLLNLGSITADGANSTIFGDNWSINPTKAVFNNVDVTGTIHTSVFETGTIQAIGGSFIFREAAKIIANGTSTITLENKSIVRQFIPGTNERIKVYATGENATGKVCSIISGNENSGVLTCNTELDSTYEIIIKIGVVKVSNNDETNLRDNLIIGVNSTSNVEPFLLPKGFTFYAPTLDNNTISTIVQSPNLFLGDLTSLKQVDINLNIDENTGSYGLYGDNVFLKGTLTTKVSDNSYAGINTINGVTSNFTDHDSERIVFWAGAASNSAEAIQQAPFQVTEEGFVYGSNARFTGTIIADSYIDAAELYTPKIYGGRQGSGNAAALSIYDADTGIIFYDSRDSGASPVLKISPNELSFKNKSFIEFDEGVVFNGKKANFNELIISEGIRTIKFSEGQIQYYNTNTPEQIYSIIFDDSESRISLMEKLLINDNEIKLKVDKTILQKDLIIGEENEKLQYKQVEGGYELYVEG